MKVLFIAPISPPVTGQSIACDLLLSRLNFLKAEVKVINLSKGNLKNNNLEIHRIYFFIKIFFYLLFNARKFDRIYFNVSESSLGNLKDLVLYLALISSLNKVYIHVHGGMGFKSILFGHTLRRYLNQFFLKRLAKVIVLGDFHKKTFKDIGVQHLEIVPNFAHDSMFSKSSTSSRNIVYLSNMIESKGYLAVLRSIDLVDDLDCTFYFAGAFEIESDRINFEKAISNKENVHYLGVVGGQKKQDLLEKCDVFILPTNYPYEGQPISILEAYASSCAVITCKHSGIVDVFEDGINGLYVNYNDPSDISRKIKLIFVDSESLVTMKIKNYSKARNCYTEKKHLDKLLEALEIHEA